MIEYDTLQRFMFEQTNVRGEIVRLRASYQAVSERHAYPKAVKQLLGEGLLSAALLSATIKFDGSLILQIQSQGPINLLVAQSTHDLHLRGLAKWDTTINNLTPTFGTGHLAITIIRNESERYQGIVSLEANNLAASIENYFKQSEQLATYILLAADENTAAGILLQQLPDVVTESSENFWEHINYLARTLTNQELLTLPNLEILKRLFHEEDIRLFDTEPVTFRCNCDIGRMEKAVAVLGETEAKKLLNEDKTITVTCEFCNYHYQFDAIDIAKIFATNLTSIITDAKQRH